MRYFRALALLLFILGSRPLSAQDPDTPEDTERWGAEMGFVLNTSGGNEQLTVLTSNIGLSHLETSSYEATFDARFRYGRSEGEEVARNTRADASIDLAPNGVWSPFLFASAENDPHKKLTVRLNGGSGVKRTFWQAGWSEVSVSGAVLYSYEELDIEELDGDGVTQTARWSWRGRARREFGTGRRLEQVLFFQPEWDDFGDYLLDSHTTGRWSLTESLAFVTTILYERDSTPAPDVGPDNWSLAVGLTAATRW